MGRIGIDLARRIGTVDRRIFGNFIEHLGRCIYGGIYDEGSPLSDARGFRQDVLEAVRPLRVPLLRWPGGNFVSGYHWLDGVGPKDQRPRRTELAWYAEESNRFGTLEFIEYCREIKAEPFICVNMGSGTMDEAQAWVEYCNGTGNTSWANLRRQHGHPEPLGVTYWGLGNEMYGSWQIGNLNAHDYVKKARSTVLPLASTTGLPLASTTGCRWRRPRGCRCRWRPGCRWRRPRGCRWRRRRGCRWRPGCRWRRRRGCRWRRRLDSRPSVSRQPQVSRRTQGSHRGRPRRRPPG